MAHAAISLPQEEERGDGQHGVDLRDSRRVGPTGAQQPQRYLLPPQARAVQPAGGDCDCASGRCSACARALSAAQPPEDAFTDEEDNEQYTGPKKEVAKEVPKEDATEVPKEDATEEGAKEG